MSWSRIPGVIWNFSQPISDNMEEAVSGVKATRSQVYGDDCTHWKKGDQILSQMRMHKGSRTSACSASSASPT